MTDSIEWNVLLAPFDIDTTPPRSGDALRTAEASLGVTFPCELRSLLGFSDGLFDAGGQWHFVWSLDRVVSDNLVLRTNSVDFPSDLLAFGDDGTGAPFCMSTHMGQLVVSWSPIEGRTKALAETLESFVVGWLSGTITT